MNITDAMISSLSNSTESSKWESEAERLLAAHSSSDVACWKTDDALAKIMREECVAGLDKIAETLEDGTGYPDAIADLLRSIARGVDWAAVAAHFVREAGGVE